MLAAEQRRRWKRRGCTQRDPRGDGCSNSSGGRLGWIKRIVVQKQNRQVEWIPWEERDRKERNRVKMTSSFLVFIYLCIEYFLINA